MSGRTVTILALIAAIIIGSITGAWLFSFLGAVVVVGAHCAIWTAIDARNAR